MAQAAAELGAVLYAVGGLPRNALMGLPPGDIDITSNIPPAGMHALCAARGLRCVDVAAAFGAVRVIANGQSYEHTTFRSDEYDAGGGHRPCGVRFGRTMEEDARRRDFTCNALYYDIARNILCDPTNRGVADIRNRLARATSDDPSIILRDDSLRILRLVRFASELGFAIEETTWQAARAYVSGLCDISWERKRDELIKILLSDTRYPGAQTGEKGPAASSVLAGLTRLYELGALCYILPALLEGAHVPQRPQYHKYDVMRHNFHACAAARPTLALRLAALLHDVGKPAALKEKGLSLTDGGHDSAPVLLPRGMTPMLRHDTLGAQIAKEALRRLRFENAVVDDAVYLIAHHMYDLSFSAKESTLRVRFATMGRKYAYMLCDIREADIRGSGYAPDFVASGWRGVLRRMEREGAPFSMEEVRCTGNDIMQWLNLPQGKAVGEVKLAMLRHCARHPADNRPERLQKLARGMLHDCGA
ncbi:MAG: CCA tRNA nucleotidyltransferase [Clostridiales bacterium]|nr:CCA tRNA nucleotidyltransferase [Clostridiales bacterium]